MANRFLLFSWLTLALVSSLRICMFLLNLIHFFVTHGKPDRLPWLSPVSYLALLPTLRFCNQCLWSLSVFSKGLTDYFTILFLDFNEAVPETERLDSKALKTRAQLSVKNRRQRPSRTRLYDSVSSTDGEDSLERKVSTPDSFLTCEFGMYPCS